jgi:hypothetical protein
MEWMARTEASEKVSRRGERQRRVEFSCFSTARGEKEKSAPTSPLTNLSFSPCCCCCCVAVTERDGIFAPLAPHICAAFATAFAVKSCLFTNPPLPLGAEESVGRTTGTEDEGTRSSSSDEASGVRPGVGQCESYFGA